MDLNDETMIFSRLFVSDYVNQKGLLDASPLVERLRTGALSVIEEAPVDGGPVALLSYHIRGFGAAPAPTRPNGGNVRGSTSLFRGKDYSLLFTANHSDGGVFDAYQQTDVIFKDINLAIERSGMNLLDNTIRTWIFVRDIDNHYENMVRARREYFADHGLTERTRYLASTGIEGGGPSPEQLVTVDSLSIGPLAPGQIVRMETPSHMSPTIVYGVTFERGLRVRFGDRSHLHISGTASIDNTGNVLHVGDVAGQTRRAVENVRALLAEQHAALSDLAYLICYVRNLHEWKLVQDVLNAEIGTSIPIVPVVAKVCRPSWLFELEGMALVTDRTAFAPFQ
jgi:enamine deaminase RidA (YjgF/YER057c/UK114 family)